MSLISRRLVRAGAAAGLGLAAMTGALVAPGAAASATPYVALSGSAVPTQAPVTGTYTSSQMSVEVALASQDEAGLNQLLSALYTKGSGSYHQWLAKGEFDSRYAPSAATRAAVAQYLTGYGLTVQPSSSPFAVRAAGSSAQVSAAFHTTLSTYQDPGGARFFANSTPVQLPATLSSAALGVVGLTNATGSHPSDPTAIPSKATAKPSAVPASLPTTASCETPYPTAAQQYAYAASGTAFPFGYGAGPDCSGLTPAQVNSIYDAPSGGAGDKGAGTTVALFEQTAYQVSDPVAWAQHFYGPGYAPDIQNVTVDGGPLNPQCPAGDSCPAEINGYLEDAEAALDVERVLTTAPDAKVIVYSAPNDTDGQAMLDELNQIAADDSADTVSSSWANGECADSTGFAQLMNVSFEQMAAQGQAMFASSGDDGPVGCAPYGSAVPNPDALAVWDFSADPWVTGVGGTSFEGYNPGASSTPGYPAGKESAWDDDNLCQASDTVVDGKSGYSWCKAPTEPVGGGLAGGGGSSVFWGRPWYQTGKGVNNPYTTYSNGTTQCSLPISSGAPPVSSGTACREVPDVSADSDSYTGYATYCTGTASLPNSQCYGLEGKEADPGWFSVAGTSSASPLWAGIAADMDSYGGGRDGFLNPILYYLFNTNPGKYFNDITGAHQAVKTNGLYPATPGYDEATGIGTPKMAALITDQP